VGRLESFTTVNEFYFIFARRKLNIDVHCDGHHIRNDVKSTRNALLVPSQTSISVRVNARESCDMLAIKVSDAFLASCVTPERPARTHFRPALNLAGETDWQIARLIYDECSNGAPHGALFVQSAATMLGISLMRGHRSSPADLAQSGLSLSALRRSCDYMEDRLEAEVSLSEVAAVVQLSVGHFAASFKRSTGLAPYAWLRQRRIARAKQLLSDSSLQLGEIAILTGYSNQSAFGVAFRRETGLTPTAWRRRIFG
jgi:AraC family transcriptional regulator